MYSELTFLFVFENQNCHLVHVECTVSKNYSKTPQISKTVTDGETL